MVVLAVVGVASGYNNGLGVCLPNLHRFGPSVPVITFEKVQRVFSMQLALNSIAHDVRGSVPGSAAYGVELVVYRWLVQSHWR